MMDESKYVTLENLPELETWACAWYDEAVEAEFTRASYHPDTATLDRLRGYFKTGLSPAKPFTRASAAGTKPTFEHLKRC